MSFEPITGRYLTVTVQGRRQRIYVEMAGEGSPVLCLHTAGADTRQWRHILNDAGLTAGHRFFAFDMPWHGKSLPPEGFQTEEYLLTTEAYIETVLAVAAALGLDRPIGPSRLRGLVGVDTALVLADAVVEETKEAPDAGLVAQLKRHFATVKHAKPPASRKGSSEWYVVAQGLKG